MGPFDARCLSWKMKPDAVEGDVVFGERAYHLFEVSMQAIASIRSGGYHVLGRKLF